MVQDTRVTRENRSGTVTYPSADAGTSKDLVTIRDEATFVLDNLTMSYNSDGTAQVTVTLYDEPEGTASGDLSDDLASYIIAPGDFEDLTDRSIDEVEDDLVIVVSNNDDEVRVNAEGRLVSG